MQRVSHRKSDEVHQKSVTGPVTPAPEEQGCWDPHAIPPFLRRETTATAGTTTKKTRSGCAPGSTPSPSVNAPAAAVSAGKTSGRASKPETPTSTGDPSAASSTSDLFSQFKTVTPEDIERKIRHEADARWRAWMPTKTDRHRPRMSFYIRQVRKEFYP